MSIEDELLDLHKYEKIEKLSNNSMYYVYKIKQIETEKIYLAKISVSSTDGLNNPFKREISFGSQYNIPSFIKYVGYSPKNFEDKARPVVVVEFCQNGSLNNIIESENKGKSISGWDATKKLICLYGIAYGISILHEKNIAFKDLTISNIFLDESFYPKIHGFYRTSDVNTNAPVTDIINEEVLPAYTAPEVIDTGKYQLKSDVYSYGILAYEIISGHYAYNKKPNIVKILTGARPQFDESVPEAYQNLIQQCWAEEVDERPSFSDIINFLKTDSNFITEDVDKEAFNNYIKLFEKAEPSKEGTDNFLDEGLSVIQTDKKQAFNCFKKSADKGNAEAMNYCGVMLLNGEGTQCDEKEAQHYLKAAADLGNIEAMNNYGYLLSLLKDNDVNDKASTYFKMAADKGSIEAMLNYGNLLYCGNENQQIQVNKKEALKYFKMAADKNNTDGIYHYALMLKKGEGVDKPDLKQAFKLFKKAADNKANPNSEAMLEYALLLLDDDADIGVSHNAKESLKYLKKAVHKDNIDAMYNYAYLLYNGFDDVEINQKEAIKYYKKSAQKGQLKAMNEFALLIQIGDIEGQNNNDLITKYYKLAADFGNIDAMYNYGWLLFNGIGVETSYEKALSYFKKAADYGNVDAMYKYATMMKYGEGAAKNKKEAANYYKKAADEGSIDAMNSYALMLIKDDEITSNDEEALKYFKMAADQGHANAMNNYGEMLLNGRGIAQNKTEAIQYFKMAADLEDQDGLTNYNNAQ